MHNTTTLILHQLGGTPKAYLFKDPTTQKSFYIPRSVIEHITRFDNKTCHVTVQNWWLATKSALKKHINKYE